MKVMDIQYEVMINSNDDNVNANINVGSSISWDGVELGFKKEEVNFCINPTAGEARSNRRDVKIVRGARNGSGVEIVADEGKNNKCVKQE